jgi:hypothetical protein
MQSGPSQPHVTDEEMKTVSAGIWHSALSIRPYLRPFKLFFHCHLMRAFNRARMLNLARQSDRTYTRSILQAAREMIGEE